MKTSIEHFSSLKQSILNELWPIGHDGASGPCSHMAFFLHDRALVGWHLQIARWIVLRQWFLEVFLGPFTNVNDKGLRPCALGTEISPVSLTLLIMLWTVMMRFAKPLQFDVEECCF